MSLISRVRLGKLGKENKSIALRVMPSNNLHFYEGQRDINLSYQVLVKSDSQLEALKEIENIAEYLITKGSEVYSEPSYLEEDEQGYTYTVALKITI